jgi:ketosteroid isomerase-like protein
MTLDVRNVNTSPLIEPGTELTHLQRLSDLHAIQQLAGIYPILVDSHDLDPLISLFTHDASFLRAGNVHTGHEELRTFFDQIMANYSMTVHTVHQHLVDLVPGARTAVGVQMGHGEVAIDGRRMLAAYRYDDEYRWEEGRWLFARRHMRYAYFSGHDMLGASLAGRQRVRVPGAAPRDAEIPEELPSHRASRAARAERGQ